MRGPSVILASRGAFAIAQRRPDALVIDHVGLRALRGREQIAFGCRFRRKPLYSEVGRTQSFTTFAAVASTADGLLAHEKLFEALYGNPLDGGPANPVNIMLQHVSRLRPAFEWAGLRVSSRKGFDAFECLWADRGPALLRPVRLDKVGRMHPVEQGGASVSMLQAAE